MDTAVNTPLAKAGAQKAPRKDVLTLWLGIAFSLGFTVLIWWTGGSLKVFPHLPQQGPFWYFWKLPSPTLGGEITAWSFYLLQQLAIWGFIWYAQTHVKKYTTGLHPINYIALGVNALFIFLHFVQTHIWYDGLAQNVSVLTSQGSVIVLLVWVLLMENSRRGLFFGKKLPISQRIIRFARKYHGYYFAWAIVYTFWYHPMENTWGHLVGFLYMFLLMLQGSLFFTRIHTNKYWTFTLEILVLAHGTMVALMQGNGLWPMFFFGFGGIFIITQMHGLNLSRWLRWGFLLLYIAGVAVVFNTHWMQMTQISYIPLIDYPAVMVLALLIGLGVRLSDRLHPQEKPVKVTS
jgi:hypothetical protein